ncbi:replication initiation negative regulator SeqA [Testudinibacter sp. P80/BLE/0925]|uniref:replication initiation negative regulator SeqA n=1 Tax=Testudinibacter sp. TW-1 TaxID=3417757 RepID=UPI003D35C3FA
MKIIEVDEELYQYIAANTQSIGESASDILRRLLNFSSSNTHPQSKEEPLPAVETGISTDKAQAPAKTANGHETTPPPPKKQSDEAIQRVVARLTNVLQSDDFQQESKGVVRFLMILTALYRANPESFAQAAESLQGRTRIYFARDEATLLQAGNHTKPRQIPESPYWVITNTNSQRKMLMLEGAMNSMHLPPELVDEVRSYFAV